MRVMQTENRRENPRINVAELITFASAEINLEVLAGKNGLQTHSIDSPRIQKLGLALAGFAHYIHAGRVQIVGQSEISYLSQLEPAKRIKAIENLDLDKICCILITKNLEPPEELLFIAEEKNLPILRTELISSAAITTVANLLSDILAPQAIIHGVLLGMFGIGVLIVGESGIGKSECALDLIARGHHLVADDSVLVKKIGENLEGLSPELTHELLEIRGLGIINIRELFGVTAIGKREPIELIIEFKRWNELLSIERLGLERQEEEILGLKLNKFVFPVSAGRNLSTLVETAVRVYLLREAGFDAAQSFVEKHSAIVGEKN